MVCLGVDVVVVGDVWLWCKLIGCALVGLFGLDCVINDVWLREGRELFLYKRFSDQRLHFDVMFAIFKSRSVPEAS